MNDKERLAYWLEQEKAAQKALEVAKEQIHKARVEIGALAVAELFDK